MNSALEKVRHSPFKCSIVWAACFLFVASIHSRAFEIPNRSMYLLVRNGFCVRNQCIWVCLICKRIISCKTHPSTSNTRLCATAANQFRFMLCSLSLTLVPTLIHLVSEFESYALIPFRSIFTSPANTIKKPGCMCLCILSHSLSLSAVFKLVVLARVSL